MHAEGKFESCEEQPGGSTTFASCARRVDLRLGPHQAVMLEACKVTASSAYTADPRIRRASKLDTTRSGISCRSAELQGSRELLLPNLFVILPSSYAGEPSSLSCFAMQ